MRICIFALIRIFVSYFMKKILFIEDESALQKTLGDVLRENGYEVISALNGDLGLSLARSQKPDLVLLDLILPKMDGLQVLSKLRAEEATKDIPVIVLTNVEDAEKIDRAIELGATAYLVKANYSLEEVVRKIEQAFNK